MTDNSVAMRAFEDQERRMIADNIRTYGVHLQAVWGQDAPPDAECVCCSFRGEGAVPLPTTDGIADLVSDPETLPARLTTTFTYTVGLHGAGHPELIVLGLPHTTAGGLLNEVSHGILRHGGDLTPGEVIDVGANRLLVEQLPYPGMVLFTANAYYQRPPWASVDGYQLTWADREGRFPWDDGFVGQAHLQPRPGDYRA